MTWEKAFRLMALPDGSSTEDQEAYLRAWTELGDFLESMFVGYRVFGYDPGVMLSHPDARHKTLSISSHAALALREGVEALRKDKPKRRSKA